MAVYAKGKKFMASVGAGANRERRSFFTEEEAQKWEQEQIAKRAHEKAATAAVAVSAPVPSGPPVWSLKEAYNWAMSRKWADRNGAKKAKINADQALDFFGADTPTSEIVSTWIHEWCEALRDEHENSNATINRKLSALRVMLVAAEDHGNLQRVPKITRFRESEHRIRWFSDGEESAMLANCQKLGLTELADFIVIGLDTGFRRGELLGLTMNDYVNGVLMVHAGETKSGKARSVPVTDRVKAILKTREEAARRKVFDLSNAQLRVQWDALRHLMGRDEDPGWIVHVLRHTCATRLVTAGVPLNQVQVWMGHAHIQTTMRYAHFATTLEGAANALNNRAKPAANEAKAA